MSTDSKACTSGKVLNMCYEKKKKKKKMKNRKKKKKMKKEKHEKRAGPPPNFRLRMRAPEEPPYG